MRRESARSFEAAPRSRSRYGGVVCKRSGTMSWYGILVSLGTVYFPGHGSTHYVYIRSKCTVRAGGADPGPVVTVIDGLSYTNIRVATRDTKRNERMYDGGGGWTAVAFTQIRLTDILTVTLQHAISIRMNNQESQADLPFEPCTYFLSLPTRSQPSARSQQPDRPRAVSARTQRPFSPQRSWVGRVRRRQHPLDQAPGPHLPK